MKNKNISFADLLRNKSRQSRLLPKLASIVNQFNVNPTFQYTLRLASLNGIYMGKEESQKQGNSQSNIFERWIQKQSIVNKQNLSSQQQSNLNANKISINKYKDEQDSKAFETKKQQKVKIDGRNQKQHQFLQIKDNVQMQNLISKEIKIEHNKGVKSENREHLRSQLNKITQKKMEQIDLLFKQQSIEFNNSQIQQLVFNTQTIHEQIANLAKKYADESLRSQERLTNRKEQKECFIFQKNEIKTESNNQLQKKRLEDAKMTLCGYFQKLKKSKLENEQILNEKIGTPKTLEPISNQQQNLLIGFSFAVNLTKPIDYHQENELKIDHIVEAKSQFIVQGSEKYTNCMPKDTLHTSLTPDIINIKNIQSVKYQADYRVIDNIPNHTINPQLITSQKTKNNQALTNSQLNKQIENKISPDTNRAQIEDIICNKDSAINMKQQKKISGPFSTKVIHPLRPVNQKLTIISSNKNKLLSNKESPGNANNIEKQTEIVTTAFNLLANQKAYVDQASIEGMHRHSKKSIRDVRAFITTSQHSVATKNIGQNKDMENESRINFWGEQRGRIDNNNVNLKEMKSNKMQLSRQDRFTKQKQYSHTRNPSEAESEHSQFVFDI